MAPFPAETALLDATEGDGGGLAADPKILAVDEPA